MPFRSRPCLGPTRSRGRVRGDLPVSGLQRVFPAVRLIGIGPYPQQACGEAADLIRKVVNDLVAVRKFGLLHGSQSCAALPLIRIVVAMVVALTQSLVNSALIGQIYVQV